MSAVGGQAIQIAAVIEDQLSSRLACFRREAVKNVVLPGVARRHQLEDHTGTEECRTGPEFRNTVDTTRWLRSDTIIGHLAGERHSGMGLGAIAAAVEGVENLISPSSVRGRELE